MSRSNLHSYARQSLVPVLGFIALSLFVINFFTFLSHTFAPNRCTAGMRTQKMEVIEFPSLHTRVDVGRMEKEMRRIEQEMQHVERKLRCAERGMRHSHSEAAARVKEVHLRMHEDRMRELEKELAHAVRVLEVEAPVMVLQ
jgi:hypothetical protein